MEALQKLENDTIDQVEAMLNDNKETEEALLREVCSLKNEVKEMNNEMKDMKSILKVSLDVSTS